MARGWRRAFCTSIPEDTESQESSEQPNQDGDTDVDSSLTPKISSKFSRFGFFSRTYTQRLQLQPVESIPNLRCRTSMVETRISSAPSSPKHSSDRRKDGSQRFFFMSNPSSPKSPSGSAILKASLRFAHSRCGICSQSVKTGRGTAVFTAECSHSFHFPCISAHIKQHQNLVCPICQSNWNEAPSAVRISRSIPNPPGSHENSSKPLKVYDDDELLTFPSPGSHFNPIPESNENEEEEQDTTEFQGFFVNSAPSPSPKKPNPSKNVEVSLLPEAVVVAVDRSYSTYATTLKVKAPTRSPARMSSASRRPPIDLIVVLDLSSSSNGAKLQMMKRTMRIVISSLFSSDRLSIVAYSSVSKRLQPLRRMTPNGRRSALRIVDALREVGRSTCVVDVLKKASKIIEDRREKNPYAAIFLLSNGQDDSKSDLLFPSPMRLGQLQIPVHDISVDTPTDDEITRHVRDLLSVSVHDLRLQIELESCSAGAGISAVYSIGGGLAKLPAGEVRVGNLYADEERELLIELKAPICSVGSHVVLSVRSTFSKPCTQQQLIFSYHHALQLPNHRGALSSSPTIERVRIFHVTIRALHRSHRLVEHNDLWAARQVLSSARTMIGSASSTTKEQLSRLDRELSELDRRVGGLRRRRNSEGDDPPELLTPTSAWRVAERLAKVAIMRKSINRVSDLHGFENAGF